MEHQIWLDKADENLAAAQSCFDHSQYNAGANRLYYAMFHAALAALAQNDFVPASGKVSHEWVQANFSSRLIHRRKTYPARLQSYLPEAFRIRVVADYETITVSKSIAANQLKKAKEFVETIKLEMSHATQS